MMMMMMMMMMMIKNRVSEWAFTSNKEIKSVYMQIFQLG